VVPVGGRIPGARRPVPQLHAAGSGNQKIGCASFAPWSRSVSGAREQLVQTLISERRTDEALCEIEQTIELRRDRVPHIYCVLDGWSQNGTHRAVRVTEAQSG